MNESHHHITTYILGILLIVAIAAISYLIWTYAVKTDTIQNLTQSRTELQQEILEAKAALNTASSTILTLQSTLDLTAEDLADLEDDYRRERDKNQEFEDQLKDLGALVGDLDKLSKTDEELLQKYSKVYFLNENYIPSKLREIPSKYILENRNAQFFHGDALSFLEDMLDEAADDDIDLKVLSAYRSFDAQTQLKGDYTQTYGSGANAFSADQGYSEHQLGTTIDLSTTQVAGPYLSFANTEAFAWLEKNAYKFGFTLSYPKDNSFYVFEPWHWRFVGTDLARDLNRANAHFYDWDQRKIDTYLISIFD